jgi:hypothetical protein
MQGFHKDLIPVSAMMLGKDEVALRHHARKS